MAATRVKMADLIRQLSSFTQVRILQVSVEVGVFKGMCDFERIFQSEGASPTNHCWCQKTRVIAVSCGIKLFAVRFLILSQYTHLTDRRTDGKKDRRKDRIAIAIPCVALHVVAR